MKFIHAHLKSSSRNLLFAILVLYLANAVFAQNTGEFSINESPLGAPTSPVMDYAGVLDAAAKAGLERRLIEFRDRTNPRVELAVAIVRTTGERPIELYSLAVARGWKIGSQEDDNPSALLFVAIDDRKYFTQISKDLEDELPDGLAGRLQRQYLVPAFRQGDYAKGVSDTIDAYIRTITAKQGGLAAANTNTATEQPIARRSESSFCGFAICLIVVFIILAMFFGRGSGGSGGGGNRWRGGGFGGGGGSALPFIVGTILGNALGGGRGGSSSGGWDGGSSGGSSWGGFGGGGDFGGGGAGGDW